MQNRKVEIISNSKDILKEEQKFYQSLYKSDPNVQFKLQNTGTKLSEEHRIELDKPFTLEELTFEVKNLKPNKCPGNDGLCIEIY